VNLYTHPDCLAHDPGPGHPESSERLRAVLHALDDPRFATLQRIEAPCASHAQLERVHTAGHVARIVAAAPASGQVRLDEDTLMSPRSAQAALRAAGAVCAAVDAAMDGSALRSFCAVRPPDHHATRDRAMGFCLFNSVAVGAAQALSVHGLQRVAIVDFDVHHGNGTQDIFADEPRVLYLSSHQSPLYPGTGAAGERGRGNIVNAPLTPGTGSQTFRSTWDEVLLPRLAAFRAQLLLVSAGFDAHRLDPLAQLQLETGDFAWLSRRLADMADARGAGRIVSSLEGGYHPDALAAGVAAHVDALLAPGARDR
jgi:acetoin utilization deacetylase AcuC-like enzyme